MMNKKIANFIFYGLILFVVAGMLTLMFILKSEGTKCLNNPFTYGAAHDVVGHGDQSYISCSCIVGHDSGQSSNFCFDDKEIKTEENCYINSNTSESNFTLPKKR